MPIINNKGNIVFGSWGFDNSYSCSINVWCSRGNLTANRIFTAKQGYIAKVEVVDGKNEFTNEFVDDQYYKTLNEFYLTILSEKRMKIHYNSNLIQSKLIKKIYAR